MLLDRGWNWPCIRLEGLEQIKFKWVALHQNGASILRRIGWNRQWKLGVAIHKRDSDSRSSLFLRIPNDDGKHSFWNLFTSNRHLHKWRKGENVLVTRNWDYPFCSEKGLMGHEMDQHSEFICSKSDRFRVRGRNILFRKFLFHFLVKKERSDARSHILKWVDQ